MEQGYRILEHPSDVGVEAFGLSLGEAFEYAALGLTSIIVEPASVHPTEQRFVSIKGTDPENLLVRWLSEILYLYDGEDFLLSDVNIAAFLMENWMRRWRASNSLRESTS